MRVAARQNPEHHLSAVLAILGTLIQAATLFLVGNALRAVDDNRPELDDPQGD